METSLIRKIIASDLPRKEQDILIMLVVAYNTVDQKKTKLDDYYETENNETENNETDHSSECESDSETNVKPKDGYDCNDHGYNKAIRDKYEERHGRILSGRELVATEYAEKSISQDHSKAWGLQFPTNTIWGNWVYSYNKEDA
jgi:hypothetical protein